MDPVFKLAQGKLTKKNIESVTTVGVKTLFLELLKQNFFTFQNFQIAKQVQGHCPLDFQKLKAKMF